MLEVARYPACVLPCHTTLAQDSTRRRMSDRKHSGSARDVAKSERRDRSKTQPMREHRHARSSAEDPTISTTRSSKSVSSNARNHPRAELRDSPRRQQTGPARTSQASPAMNHVSSSSKSNGGRKRTSEVVAEEEEEGSVWVEHTSSSGRIYYYNKKNGVSQWERPPSMTKRTKTDDPHTKSTSSSTASMKHSSHSHSSPSHPHTSSSSHPHSHSHGGSSSNRGYSSSAHHTSHSSSAHHVGHSSQGHHDRMRERERTHGSSSRHRSNRGSRSSSKSASVSPRGRGHHDKTTPTRHSRSHAESKRGSVSPGVYTAGRQSSSAAGLSPSASSIPHGISQSLVATQQVIDQTSAIIKHQQKLLSASGDPPTPTTTLSSSPPPTSTKHTPHGRSHARQKLLFHSGVQQANGPSMVSQEMAGGAGNTPTHNPLQNSGPDVSPQMTQSMGMENLHPLQRALLLQQQQQQQQQASLSEVLLPGQTTPGTPLPSSGADSVTPLSQPFQAMTPPLSALPPHLAMQISYPGSPYPGSPYPYPGSPGHAPSLTTPPPGVHLVAHPTTMIPGPFTPGTPVYQYSVPMVMPGNTPIAGIYMSEGAVVSAVSGGRAYMTPATPIIPLRPPMSRLGRRRASGMDEFAEFPDPARVESVGSSAAPPELFSRRLAEFWWSPAFDSLQRQLGSCQREVTFRRTTEALYLHGRLRRSQLSLDSIRFRTVTRRERLRSLEHLMTEIDQR